MQNCAKCTTKYFTPFLLHIQIFVPCTFCLDLNVSRCNCPIDLLRPPLFPCDNRGEMQFCDWKCRKIDSIKLSNKRRERKKKVKEEYRFISFPGGLERNWVWSRYDPLYWNARIAQERLKRKPFNSLCYVDPGWGCEIHFCPCFPSLQC